MAATAQIIIFSKDRPAQIELLLRSLHVALQDPESAKVAILYRSSPAYRDAYESLARSYAGFQFVDESASASFCMALRQTLDTAATTYLFLVDDQVFLRPFRLGPILQQFAQAGRDCATVSLRLHPGVNYSYCFRTHSPARTLDPATLRVRWADEPNNSDWSVVMSLDGNLYRREDVLPILNETEYANPCFLEHQLVKHTPFAADSFFLCQREPILVTVPLNQTQTTHHHRHGGLVDLAALNQAYLEGARLALLPYWESTGTMVHREQAPLLLRPKDAAAAVAEVIVVDGSQPLPQLLLTLESAALHEPRTAVRLLHADAPACQRLAEAYGYAVDITQAGSMTMARVVESGFFAGGEATKPQKLGEWRAELLANEERVRTGPQRPLSQYTWRNLKPTPPPTLTWASRLQKRLNEAWGKTFRTSRQLAYDASSALAWRVGQPAPGGVRHKLVSLFAGRPATLVEVQRNKPPLTPWKIING